MSDIYTILKDFGAPTAFVFLFFVTLWRWGPHVAAWIAKRFLAPIRDAILAHLRHVTQHITDLDETQAEIQTDIARLADNTTLIAGHQQTIVVHQASIADAVTKIAESCPIANCPLNAAINVIKSRKNQASSS